MRASLRPDPSKGVFETMLVLDGRPVALESHLARLADSLRELHELELPTGVGDAAREGAVGLEHGRLRVTVIRGGDGWPRHRIETDEVDPATVFPPAERGAHLHSVVVDGGLGAHKWADRRLLEGAAEEIPVGALPLLLDSDGDVLEASRASVFVARRGGIVTPPLDGRILPGIARRQVLEVARAAGVEVREESLGVDDLARAEEVFLAGSVRGIESALSIDGRELPAGGELSALVAAGLRRRWLATAVEPAAAAAGARPGDRPAR